MKDKTKRPNELLKRVFKTYKDEYFTDLIKKRKLIKPKPVVVELDFDLAVQIANYLYSHDKDFQNFHNRKVKELYS